MCDGALNTSCTVPFLCRAAAEGGAVIVQRQYHNFKQFRIYDLSDLKMSSQHLIVSAAAAAATWQWRVLLSVAFEERS